MGIRVFAAEHLDPDDYARLELEAFEIETARFLDEPLVAAEHYREELRLQHLHFPQGLPGLLKSCVGIARQLRDAGHVEEALQQYEIAPTLGGDAKLTAAAAEEAAELRAARK